MVHSDFCPSNQKFVRMTHFIGCYVATQLALQLQQERAKVVCSKKEARKRLARSHSRWTMDSMTNTYTSTQIKEKDLEQNIHQDKWNTDEEHTS